MKNFPLSCLLHILILFFYASSNNTEYQMQFPHTLLLFGFGFFVFCYEYSFFFKFYKFVSIFNDFHNFHHKRKYFENFLHHKLKLELPNSRSRILENGRKLIKIETGLFCVLKKLNFESKICIHILVK